MVRAKPVIKNQSLSQLLSFVSPAAKNLSVNQQQQTQQQDQFNVTSPSNISEIAKLVGGFFPEKEKKQPTEFETFKENVKNKAPLVLGGLALALTVPAVQRAVASRLPFVSEASKQQATLGKASEVGSKAVENLGIKSAEGSGILVLDPSRVSNVFSKEQLPQLKQQAVNIIRESPNLNKSIVFGGAGNKLLPNKIEVSTENFNKTIDQLTNEIPNEIGANSKQFYDKFREASKNVDPSKFHINAKISDVEKGFDRSIAFASARAGTQNAPILINSLNTVKSQFASSDKSPTALLESIQATRDIVRKLRVSGEHTVANFIGGFTEEILAKNLDNGLKGTEALEFLNLGEKATAVSKSLRGIFGHEQDPNKIIQNVTFNSDFRKKIDSAFKDLGEFGGKKLDSDIFVDLLKRSEVQRLLGQDVALQDPAKILNFLQRKDISGRFGKSKAGDPVNSVLTLLRNITQITPRASRTGSENILLFNMLQNPTAVNILANAFIGGRASTTRGIASTLTNPKFNILSDLLENRTTAEAVIKNLKGGK